MFVYVQYLYVGPCIYFIYLFFIVNMLAYSLANVFKTISFVANSYPRHKLAFQDIFTWDVNFLLSSLLW